MVSTEEMWRLHRELRFTHEPTILFIKIRRLLRLGYEQKMKDGREMKKSHRSAM